MLHKMLWCVLSKWLGTSMGIFLLRTSPQTPALGLAVTGILPIWLEVLASKFTRIEPSRETRSSWKIIDFFSDLCVFVLIPPLIFLWASDSTFELRLAVLCFVGLGLLRLLRFLKCGLRDGYLVGLPVTYTGYLWLPLFYVAQWNSWIACIILLGVSFWMVSERFKIKPMG